MKLSTRILLALPLAALAIGGAALISPVKAGVTFATYTNGDAATYYNSIDSTQSGNTLLTALRTLNLNKRQSTVGYSNMGTTPSGQFKYTDYDTSSVQYDSNGQPYGTKISSFYTYTSATSWNREHVWPNSHGGGSGGDAGTPYPDADIHMPRPTISSENSSRGNSFFVEGMNHSSNGWDPYTAGYSENSRGEAARITFYCTLVNSKLILAPSNTTPSGTDSVTGQSFGSGHTMGNLETLIKWNINYPVTQREKNRNEGAEYLQGNRNAFVDHPEYACKIWGNVNSTIKSMCDSASWDTGSSVSISKSTASLAVDGTTTISATSSDSSTITWTSSNTSVVTVSSSTAASGASVTLTGKAAGTATVTAKATINSQQYTATCSVTVTSSGGGQQTGDSYSILYTDLDTSYPTSATSYTAASGLSFTAYNTANFSSKVQFKKSGGYIYNNSSLNLGTLTINGLSGTLTVYAGSSSNPSSTTITGSNGVYDLTGYNYFKIINSSSSVATASSIDVGLASSSSTKTLSSITLSGTHQTTFTVGDTFSYTGLVVTAHYSDSSTATVTPTSVSSPNMSSAGTKTVTVSYTEGGVTKTATYSITVNAAKTLSSISVSTAPTKTSYTAGEYFDPTGLVIKRTYSDSTYDTYTYANHTSEFSFSPSTSTALTVSNTSVTITYSGKTTTQAITVTAAAKTLSSISLSNKTTSYTVGDTFVKPTVTATYSDSSTANVTSSTTFTGYDMNTAGTYTVTASYTYSGVTKTATYSITVASSGGSGGSTETGSQRISASTTSTYYESGDICPTGSTSSASATCDAFSVSWLKNSSSTNIAYTYAELRVYGGHSFTITPSTGYTLTSVVITANSSSYANAVGGTSFTNCTSSVSNSTVTLTPTDGTSAVGFTNSAQSRLNYIVVNYEYESSGSSITSISASVSKTFYVGETISKSDITVKDNNNGNVTAFAFANDGYQFLYTDAASGGANTSKTFTNAITYGELSCSLTVQVARKAYETPSGTTTDTFTGTQFSTAGIGSSYATNQTATINGISFYVDGYVYNNKLSLSSSKTSAPGQVYNTTALESGITDVTVNGASPDVQLSTDGSTWVAKSSANTSTNNYYYFRLYYSTTTQSNYINIVDITITRKAIETPANVANYIMYEDTNGQCTSKFNTAKGYFESMTKNGRITFMTSSDYVVLTARARLNAWAAHEGKTISLSNGDYVISSGRITNFPNIVSNNETNTTIILVIVFMSLGLITVSGFYFLKKKRQ